MFIYYKKLLVIGEISLVLIDSLLIFAKGIVILVAFSWWRLSREMKVPSKTP